MQQYGKIIAKLRKENNMTQTELGNKLNVTYQAVSKWENDQSQPDFSTMVQIAELFNVPLTVFINNGDKDTQSEASTQAEKVSEILGFCTVCGNAVHEDNMGRQRPTLLCKQCLDEENRRNEREEKERRAKEEAEKQRQKNKALAFKRKCAAQRNKGLIWGTVIAAALLIIGIISIASSDEAQKGSLIGGLVILVILSFTFTSQLFWGGFIPETLLFGGKIVGMPGVIFTLDLDGLFFLIGVKILFALIKMAVFIFTSIIAACFALICSPFTFIPAMMRVSEKGKGI